MMSRELAMPTPEKVQAVADIRERLEGAEAVFFTEYRGLTVKAVQDLRRSLRESGADYKVVKMTLAKLAAGHWDTHSSKSESAIPFINAIAAELIGKEFPDAVTVEGLFESLSGDEREILANAIAEKIR